MWLHPGPREVFRSRCRWALREHELVGAGWGLLPTHHPSPPHCTLLTRTPTPKPACAFNARARQGPRVPPFPPPSSLDFPPPFPFAPPLLRPAQPRTQLSLYFCARTSLVPVRARAGGGGAKARRGLAGAAPRGRRGARAVAGSRGGQGERADGGRRRRRRLAEAAASLRDSASEPRLERGRRREVSRCGRAGVAVARAAAWGARGPHATRGCPARSPPPPRPRLGRAPAAPQASLALRVPAGARAPLPLPQSVSLLRPRGPLPSTPAPTAARN